MVQRVLSILNDLPDCHNKVTIFCLLTRVRREAAIMTYGLASLKINSLMPYMDNELFSQSLSISPKLTTDIYPQDLIMDMDFADIMRIPNSNTSKRLKIQCPERYIDFCRPIEELSRRTWSRVLSSATNEVRSSKRLRFELQRKSMMKLAAVSLANRQSPLISKLLRRFYIIRRVVKRGWFYANRLALVAEWYHHLEEPDWRSDKLNQARRYLFGGE